MVKYTMKNSEPGDISRRDFLKAAGLLAGGAAIGSAGLLVGCGFPTAPEINSQAFTVDGNTVSVILDRVPELSRVGGSTAVVNNDEHIDLIIARTGKSEFVVASNQCTHRGKALGYNDEARQFICASGKSEFRLDGSIIKGPAERPLRIYKWHLEQGNLHIELINESSARDNA